MASKMAPQEAGQSDIFSIEIVFVCSFLGSLFNHFLTKFWTPLGVSLGVSWEPCRASWDSLGRPLHPKTLKNGRFFKVFENAASWLFELLMALLGSSCPLFGRSGPKMGPRIIPKNAQKRNLRLSICFFFLIFGHLNFAQDKHHKNTDLKHKMDQHFCTKL